MKTYTKYKNRKIYDREITHYVNFDDLLSEILLGNDFVVLDKETGFDVTSQVIAAILAEVVTKQIEVPSYKLKRIIQEVYSVVDTNGQNTYTN